MWVTAFDEAAARKAIEDALTEAMANRPNHEVPCENCNDGWVVMADTREVAEAAFARVQMVLYRIPNFTGYATK